MSKNCLLLLFLLSLSIPKHLNGQLSFPNDFEVYSSSEFGVHYPKEWDITKKRALIRMDTPGSSSSTLSYIQIQKISHNTPYQNAYLRAMSEYIDGLKYMNQAALITNITPEIVSINGKRAYFTEFKIGNKIIQKYIIIWNRVTTIHLIVSMTNEEYEKNRDTVEQIKASLEVRDLFKEQKLKKVSLSDINKWKDGENMSVERINMQRLLTDLSGGTYFKGFEIIDNGVTIENWSDFFRWKPTSVLKDYRIFNGKNKRKILDIFRYHFHLGSYDYLKVMEIGEQQLELSFYRGETKEITWILNHENKHGFEIGKKIPLESFIVFEYMNRGYKLSLVINGIVHELEHKNWFVY